MKVVTLQYMNLHRTSKGGFTRAQANALGVSNIEFMSPWVRDCAGKLITDEQAKAFEEGKNIYAKDRPKRQDFQLDMFEAC